MQEYLSDKSREYWREWFSNDWEINTLSRFAHDESHVSVAPKVKSREIESIELPEQLCKNMLAARNGSDQRLFLLLTTGIFYLVERYAGIRKTLVWMPCLKSVPHGGSLHNKVPLGCEVDPEQSFKDLLIQLQEQFNQSIEHSHYPIDRVLYSLDKITSREDRFADDIAISFDNIHEHNDSEVIQSAAAFRFIQDKACITLTVNFDVGTFDPVFMRRLLVHWVNYLQEAIRSPMQSLLSINMLGDDEIDQLCRVFNEPVTPVEYCERSFIELFVEQAQKTPNNTALIFGDSRLSYHQLDQQSNQFANYLQLHWHVQPQDRVGICLQKSDEMIVMLLGIMKCGAIYAPLSHRMTSADIESAVVNVDLKLLILSGAKSEDADFYSVEVLWLEDIHVFRTFSSSRSQPVETVQEFGGGYENTNLDSFAYIIHTSGSTNKPKCIGIKYANLGHYLKWKYRINAIDTQSVFLSLSPISFDGTGAEIYSKLVKGASVVLIREQDAPDILILKKLIQQHGVTGFLIVPSLYRVLLQIRDFDGHQLKYIVLAGEKVPADIVTLHYQKLPMVTLFNEYGPAENSIVTSYYEIPPNCSTDPLLGVPLPYVDVFVLDQELRLLPTNVTGEICVAGAGLTDGYIHGGDFNQNAFIDHPFEPGKRMYRTGDLGKWDDNGYLSYVGRKDSRVKFHGLWVDLGELESCLLQHDEIEQCIIITQKNSEQQQLVAYFISHQSVSAKELIRFLNQRLPRYMVPSIFITIDQIPLTVHGKRDITALPSPFKKASKPVGGGGERSSVEMSLLHIWQELLNNADIGIDDDIFSLGGDSLVMAQLIFKIHQQFSVDLRLKELFASPTVSQMAALIEGHLNNDNSSIAPVVLPVLKSMVGEKSDQLSAAQMAIWAESQMIDDSRIYNAFNIYRVNSHLQLGVLERAVEALIARHESLRTVFPVKGGIPRQKILTSVDNTFKAVDLVAVASTAKKAEQIAFAEIEKEMQLSPNLEQGALFRVVFYTLPENQSLLMVITHHIISDGWSHNIIMDELHELYADALAFRDSTLPTAFQYKDFSHWQNQVLNGDKGNQLKQYWSSRLRNLPSGSAFPTDFPSRSSASLKGGMKNKHLSLELINGIHSLSARIYATPFMVVISAIVVLMHRYSNNDDVVVGFPFSGRDQTYTRSIVGNFVNPLPLRIQLVDKETIHTLIMKVKESCLEAIDNQLYPASYLIRDILADNKDFDYSFLKYGLTWNNYKKIGTQFGDPLYFHMDVHSKGNLWFHFVESDNDNILFVEYNASLFKSSTVEIIMEHMIDILTEIVKDSDKWLLDIVLSDEKSEAIIPIKQKTVLNI